MPSKVQVLNFIGIVLQYSFLVLLYYFLVKVLRVIYCDLKPQKTAGARQVKGSTHLVFEHDPKLLILQKGNIKAGQNQFVLGETFSIGRGENNDIVINDSFVSLEHACITKYKHGYWLADLNSTNGTILNGKEITGEVVLNSGDEIKIGDATFKFER